MKAAILLYPGVEPIDLATFGVLSMARRVAPEISMYTVARVAGLVALANGLKVIADHGFADAPDADVLIVTGGPGWQEAARCDETLAFVRAWSQRGVTASVCTGAMILAAAGVLDGHSATTKREIIGAEAQPLGLLRDRHPRVEAVEALVVDGGAVITGGGVTLCIDAMLYLIGRFVGAEAARETARILEYTAAWDANRARLAVRTA
jgi:transcriptional regulator GlxA family with amidase domain